jgi:hypothetical protein
MSATRLSLPAIVLGLLLCPGLLPVHAETSPKSARESPRSSTVRLDSVDTGVAQRTYDEVDYVKLVYRGAPGMRVCVSLALAEADNQTWFLPPETASRPSATARARGCFVLGNDGMGTFLQPVSAQSGVVLATVQTGPQRFHLDAIDLSTATVLPDGDNDCSF